MKIFISQPLFEKTTDEILDTRRKTIEKLWKEYGKDIEIVDNFQEFSHSLSPIQYLKNNLEKLEISDLIYFTKDWEQSKNSQIEHQCATYYKLNMIYEESYSVRKSKGSILITYVKNKFIVRGINCTTELLFNFSQFQPIIISSNSNKNKTINFELAILDKYKTILLSEKFQEKCKKSGITFYVDEETVHKERRNKDLLYEVFKGQELFREKVGEK